MLTKNPNLPVLSADINHEIDVCLHLAATDVRYDGRILKQMQSKSKI